MYNKYRPRRFCIICGKEISGTRRIKTCGCEDCVKQYKHLHYKETTKEKKCIRCGKLFNATGKQKLCEECKKNGRLKPKYKTFEQTVLCKQCGKEIRKQYKNITANCTLILYETCEECKKENHIKNITKAKERMIENNPMYNKDTVKRVADTQRKRYIEKCESLGIQPKPRHVKKEKKETSEETSLRMRLNNPMYNEDIRKRASETFKKKIESGELVFKKGKENPLWKGNRTLNKHIRINLRKWVRKKFEDSNFTCQENGESHCELQVHHLVPLRNIIDNFLENYETNSQDILNNENVLNQFTQDVVDYHFQHPEIGIVVCPKCHYKLDKQYRRLTYYQKKADENQIN